MIISYLLGTAFLIQGRLVTAGHVVGVINTHDVVYNEVDIGMFDLQVTDVLVPTCRKIKVGEVLTLKGYPLIDGVRNYTEVKGKFLGYNTRGLDNIATSSLMIKATIYGGMSGGPIVDSKGYVVGVVHHKGQLVQNNKIIDVAYGASWCEVK